MRSGIARELCPDWDSTLHGSVRLTHPLPLMFNNTIRYSVLRSVRLIAAVRYALLPEDARVFDDLLLTPTLQRAEYGSKRSFTLKSKP